MGFALNLGKFGGKVGYHGGKAFLTYAPMVIPGVGPYASMAINAGLNAAEAKRKGGSWKDAAIAGGIGAATSYAGGKIPGIKGIGPSNYVRDAVAKTAGQGGFKAGLGNVLKGVAGGAGAPGVAGKGWQGKLGNIIGNEVMGAVSNRGGNSDSRVPSDGIGPTVSPSAITRGGAMPRGGFKYSENPLNQYDQSSPNLSMALHQGRQEAIKNQPFRKGYDIKTLTGYEDEDVTKPTYHISRMPQIFPNTRSQRRDEMPMRRKKRNLDNSEVTPESSGPAVRRGGGFREREERARAY